MYNYKVDISLRYFWGFIRLNFGIFLGRLNFLFLKFKKTHLLKIKTLNYFFKLPMIIIIHLFHDFDICIVTAAESNKNLSRNLWGR